MKNATTQKEQSTRIFRENPFAWYDKVAMRYLREKYGKDKKTFLIIRAVYTALTEIDSDFNGSPIPFFTKTVGTYAGVSREVAGKYLNMLEEEGLIKRTRERDPQTKKFLGGTNVHILSVNSQQPSPNSEEAKPIGDEEPLSGYPSTGLPQRWDTQANNKKIGFSQEIKINVNGHFKKIEQEKPEEKRHGMQGMKDILKRFDTVGKKNVPEQANARTPEPSRPSLPVPRTTRLAKIPEEKAKREYLANQIATELQDEKSLGCYQVMADKVPQSVLFETLASVKETWREGKIRKSRGALFVDRIKAYCERKQIDLHFSEKPVQNSLFVSAQQAKQ